jgi:hypothetical protein
MRKTNPIWAGQGPGAEVKSAKRTQFRPSARKWALAGGSPRPAGVRLCKTKPISPARARAGGKSCKTNPIPGGMGPQGRGTQGKCAERTQLGGLGLSLAAWRRGLAVGPEGHQENALRRHYQRLPRRAGLMVPACGPRNGVFKRSAFRDGAGRRTPGSRQAGLAGGQ